MSADPFTVKLADPEDAKEVWRIRFHPLVVPTALGKTVDLATHLEWFSRQYFSTNDNHCFIIKDQGRVVGYCRYDITPVGSYVVSIAVDPAYQAQGLGQILFTFSLAQLKTKRPIIAQIKKENHISKKFVSRLNFIFDHTDQDTDWYRLPYVI